MPGIETGNRSLVFFAYKISFIFLALKKKIKIEELLHYSVGAESGHNVDKNFTSNLMNLVMQFRKVCYFIKINYNSFRCKDLDVDLC